MLYTSILTRDLRGEPLHDQNRSLDQTQCKLNYDGYAQATGADASQHQPAASQKQPHDNQLKGSS